MDYRLRCCHEPSSSSPSLLFCFSLQRRGFRLPSLVGISWFCLSIPNSTSPYTPLWLSKMVNNAQNCPGPGNVQPAAVLSQRVREYFKMRLSVRMAGVALLCLVPSFLPAQQYTIATYAGGAPPITPAAGTSASIGLPGGIAVDASNNVFFSGDQCLFRLDSRGLLTRIAGNSRGRVFRRWRACGECSTIQPQFRCCRSLRQCVSDRQLPCAQDFRRGNHLDGGWKRHSGIFRRWGASHRRPD